MKVHLIGIGGIGVSTLAQYYLAGGHEVSGSDLVCSETADFLKEKGSKIIIGEHKPQNIPKETDLVVYSPAVRKDNPELNRALELQRLTEELQVLSYPQALGILTKKYYTIAVSGTHGKSTTTAMLALVLIRAGLDPTVIIGTKLKEFGGSNFRMGNSSYLVIEADEHKAAFLNYRPKIIVLTNIEREHLDYYRNLNHILRTYRDYIKHLPQDGTIVVNGNDKNIRKIIFSQFSLVRQGSGDQAIFNFQTLRAAEGERLKKILKVPGEHNVSNALAVLKTARLLKIPDKISFEALSQYQGSWRRFEEKELKIKNLKLKIISDYAHHPTEILATIKAAREKFKKQQIWLIFQPHQYQRTFRLFRSFVKTIQHIDDRALADKIIITDIFDVAGREDNEIKKRVSSKKLVKAVKRPKTIYLAKDKIINSVKESVRGGEIVIFMGAGDIYELSTALFDLSEGDN